jgi:DNA-binding NarL/FixJ family response regulator
MSPPLRIVVVDDHAVFREGLAAILGSITDVEVVGSAANGLEAIDVESAAPVSGVRDSSIRRPQLLTARGCRARRRVARVQ